MFWGYMEFMLILGHAFMTKHFNLSGLLNSMADILLVFETSEPSCKHGSTRCLKTAGLTTSSRGDPGVRNFEEEMEAAQGNQVTNLSSRNCLDATISEGN